MPSVKLELSLSLDHYDLILYMPSGRGLKFPVNGFTGLRLREILRQIEHKVEREGRLPTISTPGNPTAQAIREAWDLAPSRRLDAKGYDKDVTLEDLDL